MGSPTDALFGVGDQSNNRQPAQLGVVFYTIHPHALFTAGVLLSAYEEYLAVRQASEVDGEHRIKYNESDKSG